MTKWSNVLIAALMATVLNETAVDYSQAVEIKGGSVKQPSRQGLEHFVRFVDEELAPKDVNTLILRVDYDYQYRSHPELVTSLSKLLEVYPELDEIPRVGLPETYEWPNEDDLYCKSYCPLHPDVHGIVFSLVDKILDAYEADVFHAGMDDVFFIADDQYPRCAGKDPAELFAGEVTKTRNYLTKPTVAYFALKGFKLLTCAWKKPEVTIAQWENLLHFKEHSNDILARRNASMIQTIWSSAEAFMDRYYADKEGGEDDSGQVASFHALFHQLSE